MAAARHSRAQGEAGPRRDRHPRRQPRRRVGGERVLDRAVVADRPGRLDGHPAALRVPVPTRREDHRQRLLSVHLRERRSGTAGEGGRGGPDAVRVHAEVRRVRDHDRRVRRARVSGRREHPERPPHHRRGHRPHLVRTARRGREQPPLSGSVPRREREDPHRHRDGREAADGFPDAVRPAGVLLADNQGVGMAPVRGPALPARRGRARTHGAHRQPGTSLETRPRRERVRPSADVPAPEPDPQPHQRGEVALRDRAYQPRLDKPHAPRVAWASRRATSSRWRRRSDRS